MRQPREDLPYPNHSDDPDPIPDEASKKYQTAHAMVLREYTALMHTAYARTKLRGENLWIDLIKSLRPHTISWTRPVHTEWRDLLKTIDIHLDPYSTRAMTDLFMYLLYRKVNIPCTNMEADRQTHNLPDQTNINQPRKETGRSPKHTRQKEDAVSFNADEELISQ